MNLESMISEVLPTMLWAWISCNFIHIGTYNMLSKIRRMVVQSSKESC